MKQRLITETTYDFKTIDEGKDLYIEGVFSSAECLNNNGRRYRKSTLEREINRLIESRVNNKSCFGELSHPSTPEINLDRVAIITTNLNWNGNDLIGKAKILETPMGNIARILIKEGNLGISSRALGTVNESDQYVNEDLYMICYDVVSEPSNPASWVKGIYEGKDFEFPEEKKIIEPEFDMNEAKKIYAKHIWQVLENISKGL